MARKHSDLSNMKEAGKACIGCGRTADHVVLKRLRTYSRSYACFECFTKESYLKCANKNHLGQPCNHEPHVKGVCQHCGCERYIHGLENEHDRQLAGGIGLAPRVSECKSYGANLGKCGRIILVKPDGDLPRLCDDCMARWVKEAIDGERDARARGDFDATTGEGSSGVVLH